MGLDWIKIEPAHWLLGTNFLFQFEPVIHNQDDKVFSSFFGPAVWIIQDGKKSSLILFS